MADVHPEVERVLKTDWAVQLYSAPELIHVLGLCTSLASKREIYTLQLQDPRLNNSALISNLLHLANHGQSAFQQAHSDTYQISLNALEIGKAGGDIDKIVNSFKKLPEPSSQKRIERSLRGLDKHVVASREGGARTKAKFDEWIDKTNILQEAVANELSKTEQIVDEKTKKQQKIGALVKSLENDTESAMSRVADASEALSRARSASSEGFKKISSIAYNGTKLGLSVLTLGIAIPTFASYEEKHYLHKLEDLRKAEESYRVRSEALHNCKSQLSDLQNNITIAKSQTEKWENICKAVQLVLDLLHDLQRHVRIMVQYFASLSDDIEMLSARCNEQFREITDDTESKADEPTIEELIDCAKQIKALAMVIYTMSSVYASVSNKELFQGFQLISSMNNRNRRETCEEERSSRASGELTLYQKQAEEGIARCVSQYKQKLFQECKRIYPKLKDESLNPEWQHSQP